MKLDYRSGVKEIDILFSLVTRYYNNTLNSLRSNPLSRKHWTFLNLFTIGRSYNNDFGYDYFTENIKRLSTTKVREFHTIFTGKTYVDFTVGKRDVAVH